MWSMLWLDYHSAKKINYLWRMICTVIVQKDVIRNARREGTSDVLNNTVSELVRGLEKITGNDFEIVFGEDRASGLASIPGEDRASDFEIAPGEDRASGLAGVPGMSTGNDFEIGDSSLRGNPDSKSSYGGNPDSKSSYGGNSDSKSSYGEIPDSKDSYVGNSDKSKTESEDSACALIMRVGADVKREGYRIHSNGSVFLEASSSSGFLYGAFRILRDVFLGKGIPKEGILSEPDNSMRMLNHWDNMDGTIERGYSGNSFFFRNNDVIITQRTIDYARLCASVGINAVVLNNVNVRDEASYLVAGKHDESLGALSKILHGWGIKMFLSLDFTLPALSKGSTELLHGHQHILQGDYSQHDEVVFPGNADPLDEKVISFWKVIMQNVFARIPNLGGFLVKADSEGRKGPAYYGRSQADGANMLADAVSPYGGTIIWRCFVYNCKQDWRDRLTDRARACFDLFAETDGDYRDNVILQIKNGPMDFQVREPVHPLFGAMPCTRQMLEVQIAQEYTGQQIDVCYLLPEFREILGFRTYCANEKDTVADIISGRTFCGFDGGIAAVANTGDDFNWTGNDLAAANWYGFGAIAWNSQRNPSDIVDEWTRLTFGDDDEISSVISGILLRSWKTYEEYTSPMGIGWMVKPKVHYGPDIDGYEYDCWGTYHRADRDGVGVDRTCRGTGFAQQYREPNASIYENINTCPEELLLFFHHVPYSFHLSSGSTLIQHIYDTHFAGFEEVRRMEFEWKRLRGRVPDHVFRGVEGRFLKQLENAREWRDQVNSYFFRKSGIEDERGRKIY